MPVILTRRRAPYLTLTLRAQTAPDPARIYTLALHAQTSGGTSDPPLRAEVLLGQPPITTVTRLTLNGTLLDGLSWQHTRHEMYVEAEFTVRGIVRPALGDVMSVEVSWLSRQRERSPSCCAGSELRRSASICVSNCASQLLGECCSLTSR